VSYSRLLNYLWWSGGFMGREFRAVTGHRVMVVAEGEPSDDWPGVWLSAEVVVDGERRHGEIVVGSDVNAPCGTVLRVVEDVAPFVLGPDDRLVPQIVVEAPSAVRRCYDDLRSGSAAYLCAGRIARMDPLRRTELMTALLVERLHRKTLRIDTIFEAAERDWNQTFYTLMLTSMGGDRNREAFAALAGKATAAMVAREKGSGLRIEALLLGAAGFLFGASGEKDRHTLWLEEEARHMLVKYGIVPLKPAVWSLNKLYPANHPVVRLAEIAALVSKSDFMLDGVLGCRTSEDVERLFAASASEYWRTHYTLSGPEGRASDKTIGRVKARLMGLNLVAPLMFAYGRANEQERLCERALDLLATIPAEKNSRLDGWSAGGCTPENGFESQALLQLDVEYCAAGRCADCRLGRAEIKKMLVQVMPHFVF
jgi:hypothetical protein